MPRVFVIQEPMRRHPDHRTVELKYSLEPARQFGEIVILLGWTDTHHPMDMSALSKKLADGLADYTQYDYLLASGNPACIAVAGMIASDRTGGLVNVLVWDNKRMAYDCFALNLDECLPI